MNLFLVILVISSILWISHATDNEQKPFDHKRYKLNIKLSESLSQDPERNVFLKALQSLPNQTSTQEQVDVIVGVNFAHVKAQIEAAYEFAILLVKDDMREYQDSVEFTDGRLMRVFADFFEMMDMRLNPDTLFLNKDAYVFYAELSEASFVSIYSILAEMYEAYPPLERHIDEAKRSFMRLIKQVIKLKCPNYSEQVVESFSQVKVIKADLPNIEGTFTDKPVEINKDRLRNIFETLHKPIDPNYVNHIESSAKTWTVRVIALVIMSALCSLL